MQIKNLIKLFKKLLIFNLIVFFLFLLQVSIICKDTTTKTQNLIFANTNTTPSNNPNVDLITNNYDIQASISTDKVKPNEKFEISIKVTNNSNQVINNFEIRVPFLKKIKNVNFITEKPSFNKILDSLEYPAQFQNRSWLINSFKPSEEKIFSLEYEVQKNITEENPEIATSFILPITWIDPANLESNKEVKLDYFRFDIYINKLYKESINIKLPQYESLTIELSKVKLPDKYVFPGSKTTDLSKLDKTNYTAVENFTLDTHDITIQLIDPIDLSGNEISQILSNLDNFLDLSWGKITLKQEIQFLKNKPVKITFKNTAFKIPPLFELNKNGIKLSLSDVNGELKETETIIELSQISDIALIPDIQSEKSVYETTESTIQVTFKVSDPQASVTYVLPTGSFPVDIIDINTGEFTINFKLAPNESIKVDIVAKLKNNQTNVKSIVIKNISNTEYQPIVDIPNTISMPLNQLSLILIGILIILIIIVILIIFYLIHRRSQKRNKELEIELKNITAKSQLDEKDDPHLFPTESVKVNINNNKTISLFSINNINKKGNRILQK